jgi:uncharacterized protein YjbI with pentapeptide repeats
MANFHRAPTGKSKQRLKWLAYGYSKSFLGCMSIALPERVGVQMNQTTQVSRLMVNGVKILLGACIAYSMSSMAANPETMTCKIPPPEKWANQEKQGEYSYIWGQVCNGKEANLLDRYKRSVEVDPDFIRTILLHEPWSSAIPQGIEIVGAHFKERLDLSGAEIESNITLKRANFEKGFNAQNSKGMSLDLSESVFNANHVYPINLMWANFSGSVDLSGVLVNGVINMRGIEINKFLFMNERELLGWTWTEDAGIDKRVGHSGIKPDELKEIIKAKAKGPNALREMLKEHEVFKQFEKLEKYKELCDTCAQQDFKELESPDKVEELENLVWFDQLKYELDLDGNKAYLNVVPHFHDLDMTAARIGNSLQMIGAVFDGGELNMNSLQAGGFVLIRNSDLTKAVNQKKSLNLKYLSTGGNLELDGSQLPSLDLSGAKIGQTLSMGSEQNGVAQWDGEAELNLLNVSANYLRDYEQECKKNHCDNVGVAHSSWPYHIELHGFTLNHFNILGDDNKPQNNMELRPIGWLRKWLERDHTFTPQPYQQMASMFERYGRKDIADEITWSQKWHEIDENLHLTINRFNGTDKNPSEKDMIFEINNWPVTIIAGLVLFGFMYGIVEWGRVGKSVVLFLLVVKVATAYYISTNTIMLIFSSFLVGFGIGSYAPWHILWWGTVFVLLGAYVLYRNPEHRKLGENGDYGEPVEKLPKFPVAFSFDMFIPFIRLRESNYKIEFTGWVQRYFYVHKVMGYILAGVFATTLFQK